MFEITSSSLRNKKTADSDEGILSNEIFVILEVFCEGFGEGDWVFANYAAKLGTEVIDELTCFLN